MPVIMESEIYAFTVAAALAALAWGVTRWWYRRQIGIWAQRCQKSQSRLDAVGQQVGQARKQIEKLQRELSEARRTAAVASSQLGSTRARSPEPMPKPAAAPAAEGSAAKPGPGHGFADTLPM